jgi:putative FmdB family regulatory protein
MPLIKYQCTNKECNETFPILYKSGKDTKESVPCKKCGSEAKRLLSAPTSSSKITIDNGQPRAVEVYSNIIELQEDRIKPPNRGD